MKIEFKNLESTFVTYLLIGIFFLMGVALTTFIYVSYKQLSNKSIYYISKEEILSLETQRIAGTKEEIFYGQIEMAFSLIEEGVAHKEKRGQQIIFSERNVFGRNVESISQEIHSKIIEKLSRK